MAENPLFGEPFPRFTMEQFHMLNRATMRYAAATNENVLQAASLNLHTTDAASVVPHLLRRILSDDAVICGLRDRLQEADRD